MTSPASPSSSLVLDRRRTAVMIMDYQSMIVENFSGGGGAALLDVAQRVLGTARKGSDGPTVIYIVVGFRPGFPEVSPNNQGFSAIKKSNRFDPSSPGVAIHSSVAPQQGDIVVTKHRVGAFLGTDLDMILRAKQIDTLVLLGIATSGVVLSTVRYAADADYRIVVVRDGCADADPEVHRVLLDKVFPRQTTVTDSATVIAALA